MNYWNTLSSELISDCLSYALSPQSPEMTSIWEVWIQCSDQDNSLLLGSNMGTSNYNFCNCWATVQLCNCNLGQHYHALDRDEEAHAVNNFWIYCAVPCHSELFYDTKWGHFRDSTICKTCSMSLKTEQQHKFLFHDWKMKHMQHDKKNMYNVFLPLWFVWFLAHLLCWENLIKGSIQPIQQICSAGPNDWETCWL